MVDTVARDSAGVPLSATPFGIETRIEHLPTGRLFFHIVPQYLTTASTRLTMLSEGHGEVGDDIRFECTARA
jgi:hypothetical protein